MREIETRNAIIRSTKITTADHGILTAWLYLDYGGGGGGQAFGGYGLHNPHWEAPSIAGLFLWRVLEVVGVEDWENLTGKTIRVKAEHSKIHAIGHIIKDEWFNPAEEFEKVRKEYAERAASKVPA